jgi:hypothetical protein
MSKWEEQFVAVTWMEVCLFHRGVPLEHADSLLHREEMKERVEEMVDRTGWKEITHASRPISGRRRCRFVTHIAS